MNAIWSKPDNIGQDTAKITTLQNSVEGINTRLNYVATEVLNLKKKSQEQDEELENMKSYQRRNNLIITGVPENLMGNCMNVVIDIADYLGTKLDETFIDAAHPLPSRHGTKIIVKFLNRWLKEKILTAYISHKGGLKTSALAYDGPTQHIYLSEHLTPKMEQIYYEARQLKRANKIHAVSVRNGKVMIKETGTSTKTTISCLEDLKSLNLEEPAN